MTQDGRYRVPCQYCGRDRTEPNALAVRHGSMNIPACAPCYHEHKPGGRRPCFLCLGDRTRGDRNRTWATLATQPIPVCVTCKNSDLLAWLQEDHRYIHLKNGRAPNLRVKPSSPLAARFAEIDAAFNRDG